jgi:hypothetical protein
VGWLSVRGGQSHAAWSSTVDHLTGIDLTQATTDCTVVWDDVRAWAKGETPPLLSVADGDEAGVARLGAQLGAMGEQAEPQRMGAAYTLARSFMRRAFRAQARPARLSAAPCAQARPTGLGGGGGGARQGDCVRAREHAPGGHVRHWRDGRRGPTRGRGRGPASLGHF